MSNTTIIIEGKDCSFDGNPDLTGLGMRLSFYLQCITSALAAAFLDQQFDYLQSSGIIYFIAVLAVLIREVKGATIRAPEAAVVFWMLFLLALALGSASNTRSWSHSRQVIRLALLLSMLIYGCWFWFTGINRLPRIEGCEEWAFYLRKIELRGQYAATSKVTHTVLAVAEGLFCCWQLNKYVRAAKIRKRKNKRTASDLGLNDNRAAYAQALADQREKLKNSPPLARKLVWFFSTWFVILLSGIILSVFVPAIEMMIKWNDIRGVQRLDSVGQLAPFLLSTGMLVHVLYSIMWEKDSFKESWEKDTDGKVADCPERTKASRAMDQHELLERDTQYYAAGP
ncbi:hypothetical protein B0H66DRAFT_539370 [Apodospora peruviana]|uniref:Uncharacterized protein n=1 Tax=Apodospora peruviana TaxID=516989 RepID=A0AAE0MDV1_9PEZI|nr:hypothetical protein B0H66DRAFT_539370 [Apodospora peruviana]